MSRQSYAYDMPRKLPIIALPEEAEVCSWFLRYLIIYCFILDDEILYKFKEF